jgi:preprotein translocase subunit SecD
LRNLNWKSLLVIIIVVGVALSSLMYKQIDFSLFGNSFERGSDDVLGLQLGLDLAGGVHLVYKPADSDIEPSDDQMDALLKVIERRVNTLGAAEPNIQRLGDDRILIQLPGIDDLDRAKRLIGETASLEIFERICQDSLCTVYTDEATGLTGQSIARISAGQHSVTNAFAVFFEFERSAIGTFAEMTRRIYDTNGTGSPDQIAFILDGIELEAVGVRQPILTGTGQISGNFTAESARDLAIQLEAGRLPIGIETEIERVVDASLGSGSLEKSIEAGIVGLALVLIFMAGYYRGAGVIAALSLVMYSIIVLAVFKLVPVTLTLAGIGGFILSLGMAVDANILVFERMKEELRIGRSMAFAIQIGYRRAWPSIRDGNISTLIIAFILFWFGTQFAAGAVTGFAVALIIGVLTSMFTAVFISRNLLVLVSISPLRKLPGLFSPEGIPLRGPSRSSGQSTTERGA